MNIEEISLASTNKSIFLSFFGLCFIPCSNFYYCDGHYTDRKRDIEVIINNQVVRINRTKIVK